LKGAIFDFYEHCSVDCGRQSQLNEPDGT